MSQSSPCWAFGDDVQSFEYYTQQLAEMWPQKLMISGICGSVCSFFHADAMMLWVLTCVVVADFVAGLSRAWKVGNGTDYTKLRSGLVKIIMYLVYFLIAGAMELQYSYFRQASVWASQYAPALPIMNGFLLYCSITELSSVARNIEDMGFNVPFYLKIFLKKSQKRIENEIDKIDNSEGVKKDASGTPPDRDI